MDIVICFSPNYVLPAGVMLCSLFENNKEDEIIVHALLSQEGDYIKPIYDIVTRYGSSLCCYNMSLIHLPELPVGQNGQRPNISKEAFYRLYISEVLPQDIEKVLYLDCDIIIEDSLKTLWETDIVNYAVGVVPDYENNNVQVTNRLGYDLEYGYFNSGVLLINLKYWRENDIVHHFTDYINSRFAELVFHDQDVLNYFFYNKKKVLNIRYNFQTTFLFTIRNISYRYFEEIDDAFIHPCIIHYTEDKPWYVNSSNPMRPLFDKYLGLTNWNNQNKISNNNQKESFRQIISQLYHYFRNKKRQRNILPYDVKYLKMLSNGEK